MIDGARARFGQNRSAKAVVRPSVGEPTEPVREPSHSHFVALVEGGHVGLDVEQRRAVDHVDIEDVRSSIPRSPTSRTVDSPMAFGRAGERVAKIPWGRSSRNGVTVIRDEVTRWRW